MCFFFQKTMVCFVFGLNRFETAIIIRLLINCCFLFSSHLKDFAPMEPNRVSRVADREDEYRSRHRKNLISPERIDPFADGKF